jgi:hypothetical protein
MSLEILLELYNRFLHEQKDKAGLVILDATMGRDDDWLRHWQSHLIDQSAALNPSHIVEGTFFAKSHTSNLLQIADICTNVFYREMVRGNKTPEFRAIQGRFWRFGNILDGYGTRTLP